MKSKLQVTAQAKINLLLDVIGRRDDGYHKVEMVMQSIDLADRLEFTRLQKGIEIKVDHPEVPSGEENLVYQAVELLFDRYGLEGGLQVKINKEIPVAAGLAGGSTDAAAALVAVNKLWELGLSVEELQNLGAKLGADVPFCIKGGTLLATGIGTELKPLTPVQKLDLVLVNPPFSVSTAKVYQNFNLDTVKAHTNLDRMLAALKAKERSEVIAAADNLLAEVTMELYSELFELEKMLLNLGASKVLMSGSGPTMLGFVDNQSEAEKLAKQLRLQLLENYIIKPVQTACQGIAIKN
ncbi:4-(cytidine 5'-diphospho)-2-C-methyl-D-erythritol kinase [Acetohalobium arabaticum]|uniref:4-diphosphocytidyl-2-C-methyl-D-erythritol kinase n=1 Tax=Acetohalobium arabaticum (strain ATCC 49924 / DSM 5501 / Z-7288) TaxID=574087 RepID=D9QSU4_ACEAZ|nr:4-(cytidine 5'-diphospho)-2-C-methyl-D-erythritol kinase [Acetohalobium arabaticum]ADL11632.1 4-diphosphocytidyl-2C-methyl-D-erythritolkinase [Acetohalobium arabaticum DSM 5501]